MSTKDKLQRKKYKGVWRWDSVLVARMMSRFPSTVMRFMDRNIPKSRSCCLRSSERPRSRNCGTPV
jgi:hypothetical protein